MKQDEVDKLIADAVAESKKSRRSKWHRGNSASNGIQTARKVLNWTFMLGFLVAVIIYFVLPEQRMLFFCIGFSAIVLKLIEFYLRFMF
ncbi:MAG: hypothetical protein J1F40_10280 [Prevotellaceae bacterium]|nr:hypothetical protein [Prevotellaceae bacterium]